jgi:hypothetical protein
MSGSVWRAPCDCGCGRIDTWFVPEGGTIPKDAVPFETENQ